MPILHAIVLGIIQGLTEFLPISSSGHLIFVPWLLGWEELDPDLKKTFDVALHVGTFAGVLAYFWPDVYRLARGAIRSIARRRVETKDERMAWLLFVSAIPAAITGVLLEGVIEDHLGAEWLIGIMLIVFGLVLLWVDRSPGTRESDDFVARDAVLMGMAQALALQPGVSRAGATMSMARARRFSREGAARLSFLMSLPIIGGAGLYEGLDALRDGIPANMRSAFVVGMLTSAVTGFVAVWAMLKLLQTRTFRPFVLYRVIVGLGILGVAASSWR